jgi:predicted  nucleic acid-binding Zn-ribbon protein
MPSRSARRPRCVVLDDAGNRHHGNADAVAHLQGELEDCLKQVAQLEGELEQIRKLGAQAAQELEEKLTLEVQKFKVECQKLQVSF